MGRTFETYQGDIFEGELNPKHIENISTTYHGAETELSEYQKHIQNISWGGPLPGNVSKEYQKHIKTYQTRIEGRDGIQRVSKTYQHISKTYHGVETEFREYQNYILNISKTYHSGEARPGRVSTEYHKHIQNISKNNHGAQPADSLQKVSKTYRKQISWGRKTAERGEI